MDINSGVKLVPKWTIKKLFLGESTKKGSCHLCKTSNFIPNSYSDLFSFLRRDPILAWEIYLGPEHVSHLSHYFILRRKSNTSHFCTRKNFTLANYVKITPLKQIYNQLIVLLAFLELQCPMYVRMV